MSDKNSRYTDIPQGFLADFYAKTEGMITLSEAHLLYEMAKQVDKGCIVEVGAYRGMSSVALGRGSIDGHMIPVFSIEPHENYTGIYGGKFGPPDRGAFYQAMLDTGCYHVVRLLNASSEKITPAWDTPVSLLWIDGDHSYEGVTRDFECWQKFLSEKAIVAFDDTMDQRIGPYRLIQELVHTGKYKIVRQLDKVTVLERNY